MAFSVLVLILVGTWDAPPETEDAGYGAFRSAFKRFLAARTVLVKEKGGVRKTGKFRPIEGQPNLCKDESLALRDFQVRAPIHQLPL